MLIRQYTLGKWQPIQIKHKNRCGHSCLVMCMSMCIVNFSDKHFKGCINFWIFIDILHEGRGKLYATGRWERWDFPFIKNFKVSCIHDLQWHTVYIFILFLEDKSNLGLLLYSRFVLSTTQCPFLTFLFINIFLPLFPVSHTVII